MHADLLDTALKLACESSSGRASQTDLRRAISTVYYAAFHFMATQCADLLVNSADGTLTRAWIQVYVGIDHGDLRSACDRAADPGKSFPDEIRSFAVLYPTLKRSRERADYDPPNSEMFNENHVLAKIGETEEAIKRFSASERKHRQAFAIMIAYNERQRR